MKFELSRVQACSAGQYSANRKMKSRPSVRAGIRAGIRRANRYGFVWILVLRVERANAGFHILLLLRDSQPLREVRLIRLGRKTRSAFFTSILLASAYCVFF